MVEAHGSNSAQRMSSQGTGTGPSRTPLAVGSDPSAWLTTYDHPQFLLTPLSPPPTPFRCTPFAAGNGLSVW